MKREKCPCCSYPTLRYRGQDEICILCDWEDDNQNDAEAAQVLGGPNGDYSLKEATSNFKKNLIMYRGKSKVSNMKEVKVKKRLMTAYGKLEKDRQRNGSEMWEDALMIEKELKMLQ
jgi:hypothetical protein